MEGSTKKENVLMGIDSSVVIAELGGEEVGGGRTGYREDKW